MKTESEFETLSGGNYVKRFRGVARRSWIVDIDRFSLICFFPPLRYANEASCMYGLI
jgi:hypothetical protein